MSLKLPQFVIWINVMQPACWKVGQEGLFFSPVALCQTRCELVGNVLWAKQFASSLENSLHLQLRAVNLARQSPGSFEALVFAKDLVIRCPFATCSYPLPPRPVLLLYALSLLPDSCRLQSSDEWVLG